METVISIIQNIGFPIACVLFLGYFVRQQNDEYRTDIKTLSEKHDSTTRAISERYENALSDIANKYDRQIERFSKSIDRNTQVLTALEAKLERKGETSE